MAKVTTLPLFPCPVTLANFGEEARELNAALVQDAFIEMNEQTREQRSGIRAWQSQGGMERKYDSFKVLAENIAAVVRATAPTIGYEEPPTSEWFTVTELWANVIWLPGGFHIPHIHGSGETLFSGVYYPTSGRRADNEDEELFPDEDLSKDARFVASSVPQPGDLMLFDPAAGLKRQVIPEWVKRYPFYGSEFCLTPKQSTLIIFPNYMEHMVAPVTEDDRVRVSISFCVTKSS